MIITRTPLRISFLGGGTDYPQWYKDHNGAVISTAINKYCYITLHDGKSSTVFDLPNKSGMGSSSASTVGLFRACTDLDNLTISKLATTWEQEKLNGNCGSQDQYICSIGGFHLLKFYSHVIIDKPLEQFLVKPLLDYLMLFDTHLYRWGSKTIAHQMENVNTNTVILQEIYNLVGEGYEALKSADYIRFGQLLNEYWLLKRQLSNDVSSPMIDDIYQKALGAGAIGGKLLGGGGGGFMVFLTEPDKQASVKNALTELTYTPFEFEQEGTKVLYRD